MIDPKLQRIEIEAQIEELENNLPAHSIPPAMIMKLEELEDKLAQLKNEFSGEDHAAA
ncbi:MAG: hypothetical protein WBB64_03750 [Anaerolineales bacterium]